MLQYPGALGFQVENYDFTDSVAADQSPLDELAAQIDLLLPDILAFTAPTIDPFEGIDVDALQGAIDPGRFDSPALCLRPSYCWANFPCSVLAAGIRRREVSPPRERRRP